VKEGRRILIGFCLSNKLFISMNKLYIDVSKNCRNSLVNSGSTAISELNSIVYGDTLEYELVFVNGNILDPTLNTNSFITTSIGQFGLPVFASSSLWYPSASYSYTGSINTNTTAMSQSIVASAAVKQDYSPCKFQVKVTNNGKTQTYLQTSVNVFNSI
jgi:hypothetical protein